MRHGDTINNLGRTASHRRALLANLAIALIEHKRITTTLAKAKALRRYVEPLITKAKDNTTHSRRVVFSYLQNKDAVKELFGEVALKIGERPGGYVRVIKLGFRRGDGAETAMIELVDFNEVYNPNAGKVKTTKKTRRGGGGGTKKAESADAGAVAPVAPAVEDAVEVAEAEEVEATEELASSRGVIIEDVTHQAGGDEPAAETTEEEKKED